MRTCKKCRLEKDDADFGIIRGRVKGRCRRCDVADVAARRRADPTINDRRAQKAKDNYRKDPDKFAKRTKAWAEANRERVSASKRKAWLMRKYGLTEVAFDARLATQGDRCAMCETDSPGGVHHTFHVDHEHVVGYESLSAEDKSRYVRGILCTRCNLRLGHLEDLIPWAVLGGLDRAGLPSWTGLAITYLARWFGRTPPL